MMRSFFIHLSRARWAQRLITRLGVARKMAARFVAGESVEAALLAIRDLNARGMNASLDFLGENTASAEDASQAANEVASLLEAIQAAGVRANVSIKLSQLGLALDPGLCRQHLRTILETARRHANFVRIDMEDSGLTDRTLEQYFWALAEGYPVGIVIQSYLYRSEEDIRRILAAGGRVRLCKGAYQEPAAVAYPKKADVDAAYDRLAGQLLEGALQGSAPRLSPDGRVPPLAALATHDENRIRAASEAAGRLGVAPGGFEFQFLYGIRRDLQERLVREGVPVRVYVPYGSHWYPYFMRRLAERPANVWFFVSNLVRR